jgi:hypothetical protein
MDMSALTRPVGPLPLWGWGALAAGGALLFLARRGVPAAAAVVDPNTVAPAAPTDPTAAAAAPQPVTTVAAGNQVYDPNTAQTTAPVTISDLLGGQKLSDFIGSLGPDYQSFNLQDGALGTTVQHSAQNVVDATTHANDLAYQATVGQQGVDANRNLLDYSAATYATGEAAQVASQKNLLDYSALTYQETLAERLAELSRMTSGAH